MFPCTSDQLLYSVYFMAYINETILKKKTAQMVDGNEFSYS